MVVYGEDSNQFMGAVQDFSPYERLLMRFRRRTFRRQSWRARSARPRCPRRHRSKIQALHQFARRVPACRAIPNAQRFHPPSAPLDRYLYRCHEPVPEAPGHRIGSLPLYEWHVRAGRHFAIPRLLSDQPRSRPFRTGFGSPLLRAVRTPADAGPQFQSLPIRD